MVNDHMVPIRVARNARTAIDLSSRVLKEYDDILRQQHEVEEAEEELKDLGK